MRYAAPEHTTSIMLSIGPVAVVDGFIEVPDDLSQGDLGGLAMNGFTLVPVPAAGRALASAPKSGEAPASA